MCQLDIFYTLYIFYFIDNKCNVSLECLSIFLFDKFMLNYDDLSVLTRMLPGVSQRTNQVGSKQHGSTQPMKSSENYVEIKKNLIKGLLEVAFRQYTLFCQEHWSLYICIIQSDRLEFLNKSGCCHYTEWPLPISVFVDILIEFDKYKSDDETSRFF